MSLLEQMASFDNLLRAFNVCARGKRRSRGYQEMSFGTAERLLAIRAALLGQSFEWSGYRQFEVRDPKKRIISAAPFPDRVIHTALCRVIEPMIDGAMADSVYACRQKRGNRYAVIDLIMELRRLGKPRFVMKLDIKHYFDSIVHEVLLAQLREVLPDWSLDGLLTKLLQSHADYANRRVGLPIGNLSSQLFANFYLTPVDRLILKANHDGFYFRYMDDFVIGGPCKSKILDIADQVIAHVREHLGLDIPIEKRVPLGSDPVPFLGFLVDCESYRPLARNGRRHGKTLKRLKKRNARESRMEMSRLSYAAWMNLEPHLSTRLGR